MKSGTEVVDSLKCNKPKTEKHLTIGELIWLIRNI